MREEGDREGEKRGRVAREGGGGKKKGGRGFREGRRRGRSEGEEMQ